jgi:hypothetical protein
MNAQLAIDFPKPREPIAAPQYTIIVAAEGAAKVEVSIDDSPWRPCRLSAGFWWHLWTGYGPGLHSVKAQALGADGSVRALESRQVLVKQAQGGR